MTKMFAKRIVVLNLALSLFALGFVHPQVHAGIIETGAVLDQHDRQEQVARIQSMLAQQAVRERLVRLGVDPLLASERVARLTNAELELLEERMDELPAGGDLLAVIGVLFVVLLILELVGVTDIFKKI